MPGDDPEGEDEVTDDDLYLLHREELRLYGAYVHAKTEEARYPQRVARKRDEWIRFATALAKRFPTEEVRRVLQERGFVK
jgi:hypothetical protein